MQAEAFSSPNNETSDENWARYVSVGGDGPDGPRYLRLPSGILWPPEEQADQFLPDLLRDARDIDDTALEDLLQPGRMRANWRPRLVAGYLIAIGRRERFREPISDFVRAGATGGAGSGYCFALAAWGTDQDAGTLMAYLDQYVPEVELRYHQDWAFGALTHIDHKNGTRHAARYLDGGAWQRWFRAGTSKSDVSFYSGVMADLCALSISDNGD
ncbi:DUF6000 family protein [Actinoplanes palleronii]|uniref:Uncharacterized protein n=1 Tax=Actinoplanes palleronii TaxID=113570 RepID=A0ABQ4BP46_9ACTN|nr:DUF6000 family protein [Actinoplanes palleronii]GIE72455.1 hypothetical protein Apa02nite_085630 [Actinoplanes palleronii]